MGAGVAAGGGVTGICSVGSGVAGPGCCSGEYHLPSEAIHQPGPCDESLKTTLLHA